LTIASTAGPGIWSVNGSNAYYNGGSVGIGTSTPSALLHVNSSATASSVLGAFLQPSLLPDGFARIYLGRTPTANGCATFTYNFDAFTPSDSFLSLGLYNSSFSLNISGDGNVGIGTIYPQSKLHVAGNILCGGSVAANVVKVGSSAELFAPGGEENLRIIRGTVLANGSRLSGSGFTVTRIGIGQYSVSFDVEFPTAATITATFSSRGTTDGRFIRVTENYPTSKLYIFDVLAMNGVPTDDAFNFIAIGPR
jgi:hypothetical protein